MITKFKVGNYYRWTGGSDLPRGWSGEMGFLLDGNYYLCMKSDMNDNFYYAFFDVSIPQSRGRWCFTLSDLNFFEELSGIDCEIKKLLSAYNATDIIKACLKSIKKES